MAATIQPIFQVSAVGAWGDGYTYNFGESATQSYKLGVPLIFSSGGVAIISTPGTDAMVGISKSAATGVTATTAQVDLAFGSAIFQVSVDKALSASNAPGTGKPSDFTIGATYSLELDAVSSLFYLVLTTGVACATLLGYDPSQASLINGRVNIRFLQSTTAWT